MRPKPAHHTALSSSLPQTSFSHFSHSKHVQSRLTSPAVLDMCPLQTYIAAIIRCAACRYIKARSGAEALQLIDRVSPHLVLLDAALPDTTGLEVLQQLRNRFSQVALPVIMLTARHNERAIVEALDSGANDYAVKPFRRSELLARIRMHLRSSQRAAAVAAEAANLDPVAAALAQAEQDLSAELRDLLPAAELLKTVPLVAAQLSGLDDAAVGLSPEQLSALLGAISDTFDATVEKYALLKVECTDNCLTVAAPLTSSAANSARSSLQQDQARASQELQPSAGPNSASNAAEVTPLNAVLQQLLKMSQELMSTFDPPGAQQTDSSHPVGQKQGLSRASINNSAVSSLQAQLPDCCKGVLQLQVALHVGELHAGVVGARRPRYRLLGPALQYVKQAAAAAPVNSIVATDAAAEQLRALGMHLKPIAADKPDLETVDWSSEGSGSKRLWVVAASANDQGEAEVSDTAAYQPTDPGGMPAVDTPRAAQQEHDQAQGSLPRADPVELPTSQQVQPAQVLTSSPQQASWATLLLQQQQQLMALAAQLGAVGGTTLPSLAGLGLGPLGWPSGLAPYGLPSSPTATAHSSNSGTAPPCRLSSGEGSASSSDKPAASNASTVSSSCAGQQQTPPAWAGVLNGMSPTYSSTVLGGNAYLSAAADLAGALGALGGLQLGPAEAQQLLLIQQEIDALQRQMSAVAAGCIPCPSFGGCRAASGACTPTATRTCQGNGKLCGCDSPYAHARSPVAVAALASGKPANNTSVTAGGVQRQTSSSAGQLSPRSNSEGGSLPASRRNSSSPEDLLSSPGQPGRRSSFGQLFKRRSRKQKTLAE
eukprot:GHUV01002194.1.p1 GENE.GHUV01002194.1~~GHUV01002194.1.p1  ORF type:complete len:827 (+),score=300.07 GHUV01002194.1:202-2682(+)